MTRSYKTSTSRKSTTTRPAATKRKPNSPPFSERSAKQTRNLAFHKCQKTAIKSENKNAIFTLKHLSLVTFLSLISPLPNQNCEPDNHDQPKNSLKSTDAPPLKYLALNQVKSMTTTPIHRQLPAAESPLYIIFTHP